jgi:predicted transcriptional regulator
MIRQPGDDLRKLFLHPAARWQLEALRLTDGDLELISKTGENRVGVLTTTSIAFWLGISPQSASGRLSRLHVKGYLDRVEAPDTTGGYFFKYRLKEFLR